MTVLLFNRRLVPLWASTGVTIRRCDGHIAAKGSLNSQVRCIDPLQPTLQAAQLCIYQTKRYSVLLFISTYLYFHFCSDLTAIPLLTRLSIGGAT